MKTRGFLICFEGIDGAGKRVQADALKRHLARSGRKASIYAYPNTKSIFGKLINSYLNDKKNKNKLDAPTLFILFASDILLDQNEIREKLARGEVVLLDRYITSTLAYQAAQGMKFDECAGMARVMGFIVPDVTFFIDISPETSARRKRKQKGALDRFEENRKFLARVRANYRRLSARGIFSKKWIRINGEEGIEKIAARIREHLKPFEL
ncbi:MAG: dTMP kinase [Candidatus Micrarchaeota archaeon]